MQKLILILVCAIFTAGCASQSQSIVPPAPKKYAVSVYNGSDEPLTHVHLHVQDNEKPDRWKMYRVHRLEMGEMTRGFMYYPLPEHVHLSWITETGVEHSRPIDVSDVVGNRVIHEEGLLVINIGKHDEASVHVEQVDRYLRPGWDETDPFGPPQ